MQEKNEMLPEIIVFAGPNGSGKTTITSLAKVIAPYINADDIKRATLCSDMEAAVNAEELREDALQKRISFTFETVLSTNRNLELLKRAKENGYFIRCIYVLTSNSDINVLRVEAREASGGHGVPKEKIKERYEKCLRLLPEIEEVCDIMHVYDNTVTPFRIYKKRKEEHFIWENEFWSREKIENLLGISKRIRGRIES